MRLIATYFVALWSVLGFRPGFLGFTSLFTGKFVSALSLQLDLELPGQGAGAFPKGALHAPWFRHLESLQGIAPQLYADNLKCSSCDSDALLASAKYTVAYVKAVGQNVCFSVLPKLTVSV